MRVLADQIMQTIALSGQKALPKPIPVSGQNSFTTAATTPYSHAPLDTVPGFASFRMSGIWQQPAVHSHDHYRHVAEIMITGALLCYGIELERQQQATEEPRSMTDAELTILNDLVHAGPAVQSCFQEGVIIGYQYGRGYWMDADEHHELSVNRGTDWETAHGRLFLEDGWQVRIGQARPFIFRDTTPHPYYGEHRYPMEMTPQLRELFAAGDCSDRIRKHGGAMFTLHQHPVLGPMIRYFNNSFENPRT